MLHGDAVSAFGAFHYTAEPAVCALARISDLCVVRELVLTAQKEVGGYNTGTVQHCKVMILDVSVFAVVCLALTVQEKAVLPVECTLLRHDL